MTQQIFLFIVNKMPREKGKTTRLDRAKQQRLYYMGTALTNSPDTYAFLVTGSSGKLYTVSLLKYADRNGRTMTCNCMDHRIRKSNCKHMLFLSLRVLKLSEERVEQLANGKSIQADEFAEIAANAGGDVAHEFAAPKYMQQYLRSLIGDRLDQKDDASLGEVEKREPVDGDDCPVCLDRKSVV